MGILRQKKRQIHLKQNKKNISKIFGEFPASPSFSMTFHDPAMKKTSEKNFVTCLLLLKIAHTYILLDDKMS